MYDVISKESITSHLNCSPAINIYVFDEIDSTNKYAKALPEDCALVVSDYQSTGRGRLNRSFFSPKGSGVYFSLKVKIPSLYQKVPYITTLAATAVHKAIKAVCNINCGIKWVNDIYIGNKKVSGILCESIDDSHAVIGVGINVYPSQVPPDLQSIATHLVNTVTPDLRNRLIASTVNSLISSLSHISDKAFMEYYRSHSIVIGKAVTCIQGDNTFEAIATDIDDQGGLVVKTESFTTTLSSGEISVRFNR